MTDISHLMKKESIESAHAVQSPEHKILTNWKPPYFEVGWDPDASKALNGN